MRAPIIADIVPTAPAREESAFVPGYRCATTSTSLRNPFVAAARVPSSLRASSLPNDFDKLKQSLTEGLKPYALFNARQQMNTQARDMYQKALADYAAAEENLKKLQP
jgi:hypothetical protein